MMASNESVNPYIVVKDTTTQFSAKHKLSRSRIAGSLIAWFWADLSSLLPKAGR